MKGVLEPQRLACLIVAFAVAVSTATAGGEAPTIYPAWTTFTIEDGLPDSSVRAIHVDADHVWVGTDGGLALLQDGTWRSWSAADGLPKAPITAIDIDASTGDVWLGSWGGGLVRFTGGRFDRFTQYNSGLAGDLVLDVVAGEGTVWAATNGGISSFEPNSETWGLYLEARVDTAPDAATAVHRDADGLYAGTWCGPLLRFDPERDGWDPILQSEAGPEPRAIRPGGVSAVATAEAGAAMWWTARGRLSRRTKGKRWRHLGAPTPAGSSSFVNCLAARSDSEAWLGTRDGLQVLTDWKTETWVTYRRNDDGKQGVVALVRAGQRDATRTVSSALPDNRIRCLAFKGDDVWVGTPEGLGRGSGRTRWDASGAVDSSLDENGSVAGKTAWRGEARIGMFASSSTPIPRPGAVSPWPAHPVDRVAVGRAVQRANTRVAQSGKRFVLAENLDSFAGFGWGTVEDSFAALRHRDEVSGIVAYIGTDARMNSALALDTEIPVVNFALTEPAIHESENPWLFRCGAADPRRPRWLMERVLGSLDRSRPFLLKGPSPESRAQAGRWLDQAEARGLGPVPDAEYLPEPEGFDTTLEAVRRFEADVLFTWDDAQTTAMLVRRLRAAGLTLLVVGSPRIVSPEFITLAGADAGAVIALSRCSHFEVAGDLPHMDEQMRRRRPAIARSPRTPQTDSSFDAAAHLMVAIERAGPDRESVRRLLHTMGEPTLAILEDGEWRTTPLDAP